VTEAESNLAGEPGLTLALDAETSKSNYQAQFLARLGDMGREANVLFAG
jgi:hypothetical protein